MHTSPKDRHRDKRKRSRSPYRKRDGHARDVKRSRSRSPYRHKDTTHRHRHRERSPARAEKLPFSSRHLHKRDLETYRPLLAEYLDLQKHLDTASLSEDEVKGRWKSFLRKWNAGELAEGWYDPDLKRRAEERANGVQADGRAVEKKADKHVQAGDKDNEDGDSDGYGPALPGTTRTSGPAVPSIQDLQHRRELDDDERSAQRASAREDRKADRKQQKERLEELAPRADPGSRERQLEKRHEVAASNRAFADAREGGAEEVGDGELLGDDGGDAFKRQLKETERRKNEREVRKEEVLRARAAEREERMAKARAKEERTMEGLRAIARARFGGGVG